MHADDMDFQIEADLIGIMCPGLTQVSNPKRENKTAWRLEKTTD